MVVEMEPEDQVVIEALQPAGVAHVELVEGRPKGHASCSSDHHSLAHLGTQSYEFAYSKKTGNLNFIEYILAIVRIILLWNRGKKSFRENNLSLYTREKHS